MTTDVATSFAQPQSEGSRWGETAFVDVLTILRRNPSGTFGLMLAILYVVVTAAAPLIAPYSYEEMAAGPLLQSPTLAHPFGTDEFGRDMFSRVILGSRISLRVGLIVVVVAGTVGSAIGLLCGFCGGWVDEAAMRVTDIFMSVPSLVLALTIATSLGSSIESATLGIAMVRWTQYARLMRSGVLAEKGKQYVLAARAQGAAPLRIVFRHLLPNSYAAVLVQATMDFGMAILMAAGLSFVGAGASPPLPEWGALVASGRDYVQSAWWIATFPGLAIFGAVLAFNLLGDMVRDIVDPRLRK